MDKLKVGSLEAFVATNEEDILHAQKLRYRIFVEEMGAKPSAQVVEQKRDFDKFDDWCDHLLVRDAEKDQVVGAYRILRRSQLPEGEDFYTQSEFNLDKMLSNFTGEVMELGRSCVDTEYRDRSTMQLLWKAIGEYIGEHNVELMFGCASFKGSDSKEHAKQLSYLYHSHLAPEELRASVREEFFKPIDLVAAEEIDGRRTVASLPPLIKGYLRLGGYIGNGAFEDYEANTTDVCIILPTENVAGKYMDKFGAKGE